MTFRLKSAALVAALSGLSVAHAASCPAGTPGASGDSAYFVSQSVPNSVRSGQSYSVSVTFCNNGTTTWTYQNLPAGTGYVRLGSLYPHDNQTWGLGRVDLSPGDSIAPGSTKTFNFTIVAPTTVNSDVETNFQFGMVREGIAWFGAGASEAVYDFYTPAITLQNRPNIPPVTVDANGPGAFSFNNFAGANVQNESYVQAGRNHRSWIPSASQMNTIAAAAHSMNLKYLRMAVVIPPDATSSEYVASEWYTPTAGSTANATNVNTVIAAVQAALSAASAYNLKVIIALDGYTEYDVACSANGLWKKSYDAVQGNAATIVRALSGYPALYAWDILNEPLWNASAYGCLNVAPSAFDRGTQAPLLSLPNAPAQAQSVAEVVEAVHAMYNLVRTNDAYNHPTTVGEGNPAFVHYWTDISSFASPHVYVSPQLDIINWQISANKANAGFPQMMQFGGAPTSTSNWSVKDPVVQSQLKSILAADINVLKSETFGADSVPLPLVIGEYGASAPSDVLTQQDQTSFFYAYMSVLASASQSAYTNVNIGALFWDLQLPQVSPNFSLIGSTGVPVPAAQCVAIRQGGVNQAPPAGCSP